jgi:hypothetical protein
LSTDALVFFGAVMMTLGNMRENGVTRLAVYCDACHHDTIFDVSAFADEIHDRIGWRQLRSRQHKRLLRFAHDHLLVRNRAIDGFDRVLDEDEGLARFVGLRIVGPPAPMVERNSDGEAASLLDKFGPGSFERFHRVDLLGHGGMVREAK